MIYLFFCQPFTKVALLRLHPRRGRKRKALWISPLSIGASFGDWLLLSLSGSCIPLASLSVSLLVKKGDTQGLLPSDLLSVRACGPWTALRYALSFLYSEIYVMAIRYWFCRLCCLLEIAFYDEVGDFVSMVNKIISCMDVAYRT